MALTAQDQSLDEVVRVLAAAPLFAAFSPAELAVLARQARRRGLREGATIFFQGDAGDGLYIVLRGTVKITIVAPDGQETLLALLGRGECFGEMAVLDGLRRSATASALERSEVLFVPREGFRWFVAAHPAAWERIALILARRLRDTDDHVADLVFRDVVGRLAKRLLDLAESHGQPIANGGVEITLQLTQQDLATLVGASRESVNKGIKHLRTGGTIAVTGQRIAIVDRGALRALVDAAA